MLPPGYDRYPREAFACGLRILGEGQLSLTKFLLVTDGSVDVADFGKFWMHVLERIHWERDLFVFANVSQDTLDYTGPSVNKGSKAMLLGLGKEKKRELPQTFSGSLPSGCIKPTVYFCPAPWLSRDVHTMKIQTWRSSSRKATSYRNGQSFCWSIIPMKQPLPSRNFSGRFLPALSRLQIFMAELPRSTGFMWVCRPRLP